MKLNSMGKKIKLCNPIPGGGRKNFIEMKFGWQK
jgi:hypothetical protein